ncbi:unnamed protein product [Alopecurus aequalis]
METAPAASRAGGDRLSDLPDCLLHSVLSSLRSRQAIQTSLLSRRWRNVWRSVPCLDVDQRDFLLHEPEPPAYHASDADEHAYSKAHKERHAGEIERRRRRFEDFADAVLLFHGVSPIDACRLHVADPDLRADLDRWIRRGLARHPTELHVAYNGRSHHEDEDVVRSPTLFSLDSVSGGTGVLSVTTRLRSLHLSGLTLSKTFVEELKSQCPVLEDLSLLDCEYDYKFQGRIASSSLKRLHIQGLHGSYNSVRFLEALAVPALVSLNLDRTSKMSCSPLQWHPSHIQMSTMAAIDHYGRADHGYFLKSVCNSRVLELRSFTTTGLLEDGSENFRQFHNLRTLILIECEIGDRCQVLRYVLENVSSLERLVVQNCKTSGFCRGESASSWCGTPFQGCKNLKSIQVKYKDHDVPRVLVDVLTQIAKDVLQTHHGKRNYVGLLDWMRRVVGWRKKILKKVSAIAESDNSLSDEEHESHMWKHQARKKHDRDYTIKAQRRGAHLARR